MITKGRYHSLESKNPNLPFAAYQVIDTEGKTLGERYMCATDTEEKANHIASALNFNAKPSEYGYRMESIDDV